MRTEEILQGYSAAEQKRIVEMTQQLGLAPDDPMFQIMATLGRYEETMIDLQARMEAMIEAWAVMIDQKLANTSRTAQSMHNTVVSAAVRDVLTKEMPKLVSSASFPNLSGSNSKLPSWSSWAIVGGLTAAGALLASLTTWNVVTNLGQNQSVVVSNKDLSILRWLKSNEGKQTYQLFVDNRETLAACHREHRLQGYCLIKIGNREQGTGNRE